MIVLQLQVMKLASTNKTIDPEHERFFFAHDENLSYVAEQKFGEQSDDEEDEEEGEEEEEGDVTLPKHLKITVNRGDDCVILEKNKDECLDKFKSVSVATWEHIAWVFGSCIYLSAVLTQYFHQYIFEASRIILTIYGQQEENII